MNEQTSKENNVKFRNRPQIYMGIQYWKWYFKLGKEYSINGNDS